MDLDSDIEVVIGPYEVYEDELFNYKASFTAFVTVRDRAESEKLAVYVAATCPEMEKNLPIPDEHMNTSRKFESPIRVVQEVYTAGDTRAGVQTSAFNLPNDERVRQAKGSKKVLLKNVMEAKFRDRGPPDRRTGARSVAASLGRRSTRSSTTRSSTSSPTGSGPGIITGPDGRKVEARLLLKNLYSDDRGVQGGRRRNVDPAPGHRPEVADFVRRGHARGHDLRALLPLDPLRGRRGARRRHGRPVELVRREGRPSCPTAGRPLPRRHVEVPRGRPIARSASS